MSCPPRGRRCPAERAYATRAAPRVLCAPAIEARLRYHARGGGPVGRYAVVVAVVVGALVPSAGWARVERRPCDPGRWLVEAGTMLVPTPSAPPRDVLT